MIFLVYQISILIIFNMKSSQENIQQAAKTYGVQETFNDAFMVFWMFLDSNNIMKNDQKNKLRDLYENVLPTKSGKVGYFPLVKSFEQIQKKPKNLKIKNKIKKLMIDVVRANLLLDRNDDDKQIIPDQIYIIAKSDDDKNMSVNLVQKYKHIEIFIFENVAEVIEIAEKDVRKWVDRKEIFRNLFPLEQKTFQLAFERRVKLYACRNLDRYKYNQYLLLFNEYVVKELKCENPLKTRGQNKLIADKLTDAVKAKKQILKKLRKIQFLKKQMKKSSNEELNQYQIQIEEANNQISQHYKSFVNIMLTLYKGNGYFYQIINNGLKKIGSKQFRWQQLALPFSFLYEAILYKFQHNSQNLLKQIASKKEYILYRGGRMTQAQKQDIKKNYQTNPFYQSLSFTSTSKSKEIALSFLKSPETNCLFKYIIRPPKKMDNPSYRRFLMQSFCQLQNDASQKQDQVLLNSMTVAKVINVGEQKLLPNCYNNITVITLQVGFFEDLFLPKQNDNIYEDRNMHKDIVNHFKHTMELVLKFEEFSFSSAYELCNQMKKSYDYIVNQNEKLNNEYKKKGKNNNDQELTEKRLQFFHSQQNYYSRLAQICRKMGNLQQASIHAQNAINKYKQLENIDKNRVYQIHQQKLEQMYLKTSQICIQRNKFEQARQILTEKILQLSSEQDPVYKQKNQVLISRMKLDLGTVYFKQGKTEDAKKIFGQSSQAIEKIFKSISYEQLKQETFWLDWIAGWFTDDNVKIFDGNEVYFDRRRKQRIQQATKVYGPQDRLLYLKNSANLLSQETIQAIRKHKEHFKDSSQYEIIIKDIKKIVDEKIYQDSTKNTKDTDIEIVVQQRIQNYDTILMNDFKKARQQIDENFIINKKSNLTDILDQQKMIYSQKKIIQEKFSQFWKNPKNYHQSPIEFQQKFSEHLIEKQRQNRQVLLKHSDQITIEELSAYYKDSAKVIEKYIKDLQQWGYQASAPKVLQQVNNLIKLYIDIDCKADAQKKIEQVKKIANFNKESKYYELAVAYFLSGKILQNCTDRDYIYMERKDEVKTRGQKSNVLLQKKDSFDQQRLQKAEAALQQFNQSQQYFQNALVSKVQKDGIQNREAYDAQPQQVQLKIWKMKSLLVKFQLQKCEQAKSKLLSQIFELKNIIQQGLKKIKTSNSDEIQAQYKQTNAIFYYFRKQYKRCFQQFNACLKIRANKLGQQNWQNILTMLKIINYFHYSQYKKTQLQTYKDLMIKSYDKFKNYPFYWKISLAIYYLNKDCPKIKQSQLKRTIQYLQNALHGLVKIGFVQKSLYNQYCQIYDIQYSQFYEQSKNYLNQRPKIIKQYPGQLRKKSIRNSKVLKKIQSMVPKSDPIIESQNLVEKNELDKLNSPPKFKHFQSQTKENNMEMSKERSELSNLTPLRSSKRQQSYLKKSNNDFEKMSDKLIIFQSPLRNESVKQKIRTSFLNTSSAKINKDIQPCLQASERLRKNSREIPSSPNDQSFIKNTGNTLRRPNSSRNSDCSSTIKNRTNNSNKEWITSEMATLQLRRKRSSQNQTIQSKQLILSKKMHSEKISEEEDKFQREKISTRKLRRTYINAQPPSRKSSIKHSRELLENPQRSQSKDQFFQQSKQLQILNKTNRNYNSSRIRKKI